MKYLIIIVLLSMPVFAQDKITNLRVVCAAGKNPVAFKNVVDADNYAQSRPCTGRTYVEANYYYLSTSSSSSKSSLPATATYRIIAPKQREDGTTLSGEIAGYELRRSGRVEWIPYAGESMVYVTMPPAAGEIFNFFTKDVQGNYSKLSANSK